MDKYGIECGGTFPNKIGQQSLLNIRHEIGNDA